jgi:hypothetical protein
MLTSPPGCGLRPAAYPDRGMTPPSSRRAPVPRRPGRCCGRARRAAGSWAEYPSPARLPDWAERVFAARGAWAVFFGRFIALLRIVAAPLAGSLKMPYARFLAANACGGIAWAAGMTYLIWFVGVAAERWLSRLSWAGLIMAAAAGVVVMLLVRRKTRSLAGQAPASPAREGADHSRARPQHLPADPDAGERAMTAVGPPASKRP